MTFKQFILMLPCTQIVGVYHKILTVYDCITVDYFIAHIVRSRLSLLTWLQYVTLARESDSKDIADGFLFCLWRHSSSSITVKCIFISAFLSRPRRPESRNICFHPRRIPAESHGVPVIPVPFQQSSGLRDGAALVYRPTRLSVSELSNTITPKVLDRVCWNVRRYVATLDRHNLIYCWEW